MSKKNKKAEGQIAEQAAVTSTTVTKPVEKQAKPKVDRRPYITWLTEQLETPQDRKALLKEIMEKWPAVSKGGAQTFLTDMLNPKYTFFKERPVIKLEDGLVVFADKTPVTEQEATEQPVTEPEQSATQAE